MVAMLKAALEQKSKEDEAEAEAAAAVATRVSGAGVAAEVADAGQPGCQPDAPPGSARRPR